uniref:Dehydrogenase/reductase SDR family member 11 n=1 Tax=Steinernema glaseri TaxID=37863 RepID=A0A1I7YF58_9BILA
MSGKYKCRRLEGKVVIITAATAGIGLAIAERLGNEGAAVVISSRKADNVKQAVEQLREQGVQNVEGIVCHVGNAEHRERLVKFVSSMQVSI